MVPLVEALFIAPPPPVAMIVRCFDRDILAASVVRNTEWVVGLRDAEDWGQLQAATTIGYKGGRILQ